MKNQATLEPTPHNLVFGSSEFPLGYGYGNRRCQPQHRAVYPRIPNFNPRSKTKILKEPPGSQNESAPISSTLSHSCSMAIKEGKPLIVRLRIDERSYTLKIRKESVHIVKEHGLFKGMDLLWEKDKRNRGQSDWMTPPKILTYLKESDAFMTENCCKAGRKCHPPTLLLENFSESASKFLPEELLNSAKYRYTYTSRRGVKHNDRSYYFRHGLYGEELSEAWERIFGVKLRDRKFRQRINRCFWFHLNQVEKQSSG